MALTLSISAALANNNIQWDRRSSLHVAFAESTATHSSSWTRVVLAFPSASLGSARVLCVASECERRSFVVASWKRGGDGTRGRLKGLFGCEGMPARSRGTTRGTRRTPRGLRTCGPPRCMHGVRVLAGDNGKIKQDETGSNVPITSGEQAAGSSFPLSTGSSQEEREGDHFSWSGSEFTVANAAVRNSSAKRAFIGLSSSLLILLSGFSEVAVADAIPYVNELHQVAAADVSLSDVLSEGRPVEMMMRGMTAKNFDPVKYAGRWYEVASLKKGFAGQGQEDCHCTQGIYTVDEVNKAIRVDTFCVHGGPGGYITGIRGKVQCVPEDALVQGESDGGRPEMIKEKCFLRFPTLPFIPKEPYDVIDTDYLTFALVSGARDSSFVQIYSRTPNPGQEFIEKYKAVLAKSGYNPDEIKDTPQDCPETSMEELESKMSAPGVENAMTNTLPVLTNSKVKSLDLGGSLRLPEMKSMLVDTFKKLFELYRN